MSGIMSHTNFISYAKTGYILNYESYLLGPDDVAAV